MINVTNGELIFRKDGQELNRDVRSCMDMVARAMLSMLDLEDVDLSKVSTATLPAASYPKFVLRHTLLQATIFDAEYLRGVWAYYRALRDDITPDLFYQVMLSQPATEFGYKRTYALAIKRGLGLLLVALHCRGSITLPMAFDWPPALANSGGLLKTFGIYNELLGFLRLLEGRSDQLPHPAFISVGTSQKRREWFLTYGTKLLLATGWLAPGDGNIRDLEAVKAVESDLGVAKEVLGYRALIDVLRARYPNEFSISVQDWTDSVRPKSAQLRNSRHAGLRPESSTPSPQLKKNPYAVLDRLHTDILSVAVEFPPGLASAEALAAQPRLPGLTTELPVLAATWLDLEGVYKRTVKKESYKDTNAALGYLNIYLFLYLAFWFQGRSDVRIQFPDEPKKLISSVFVSRLMKKPTGEQLPLTLVEFLEEVSKRRGWENSTHSNRLYNLAGFFNFLEDNGDDLDGCDGFRQPIPNHAFPPAPRPSGTDKRPIPRRLFSLFLDYVEALKAHLDVVLRKVMEEGLDGQELRARFSRCGNGLIDTFATCDLVGFVPVVFSRGKTIPLRFIPNCLALEWYTVQGGRRLLIPQPHALNQIVAALYTGVRHNHLQWLDVVTFDNKVVDELNEFAQLFVNTDKVMTEPWTPHVNMRVIQVLRDQRSWRSIVAYPEYEHRHYYNNNASTKWHTILPLFSAGTSGRPHHDGRYMEVWYDIVSAVDALRAELFDGSLRRLSTLEPPWVRMDDPSAKSKRARFGAQQKTKCELRVKTAITPHSTRVSVVSHLSTFLPAEVIGSQVTGQTLRTVHHYIVLEADEIAAEQTHQALRLREKASRGEHESWGKLAPNSPQFIHADSVNSHFAKSLRRNLEETLVSYGCISITLTEGATSGLDVLRETKAYNAAENKTEICPYGNACPQEVILQWRGPRRCGLCQYAVRSIDHLPAVSAKVKQMNEELDDLTSRLVSALEDVPRRYSDEEFDRLDDERSRIAEELSGWRLNEEVLDANRVQVAAGHENRRWIVQKPEIILQDLQRVAVPNNLTAYLITRLGECIAYPGCESPQIRARIDILRRSLLARCGDLKTAFEPTIPSNPAGECAGVIRTLMESNKLTYRDVARLLESDDHLKNLPTQPKLLLLDGEQIDQRPKHF